MLQCTHPKFDLGHRADAERQGLAGLEATPACLPGRLIVNHSILCTYFLLLSLSWSTAGCPVGPTGHRGKPGGGPESENGYHLGSAQIPSSTTERPLIPELALQIPNTIADPDVRPLRTLDRLARGEVGVIVGIEPNPAFGDLDESVTRRLKELGFLPGAPVRVVAFGAFRREPMAVRVAEGTFALRRQEAAKIVVAPRDR